MPLALTFFVGGLIALTLAADRFVLSAARLSRALAGFPIPQDILVYTTEETEHWANSRNHVVARALREGKVLYERT